MIRYARPADYPAIHQVESAAFGRADEADLVERLRADGDVVFELVEDLEGEIVGHILFSRLWADRVDLFTALAPMAVVPRHQKTGVGGRLIRGGLDSCREFSAHGVLVLGHPDYYPRFGFSHEAAAHVRSPYSASPAFMALALEDGAFDQSLTVAYPSAFGN
jgi:putative acetyltransferase